MDLATYQTFVRKWFKSDKYCASDQEMEIYSRLLRGNRIASGLGQWFLNSRWVKTPGLQVAVLAITSEWGEFSGVFKKAIYQHIPLDSDAVVSKAGDVVFYLIVACQQLHADPVKVLTTQKRLFRWELTHLRSLYVIIEDIMSHPSIGVSMTWVIDSNVLKITGRYPEGWPY